jgi:hypothetical protein
MSGLYCMKRHARRNAIERDTEEQLKRRKNEKEGGDRLEKSLTKKERT